MRKIAMVLACCLVLPFAASAEGNIASKPVDLPELMLTGDLKMSETEYQLETGKYYRISISSDGQEEFAWFSPELFRNSWVNQVVVNDLEVKAADIYSLEFDAAGTFILTFVPLRPGKYDFYVDGYADKGMLGSFIVN
jgi:uncharacterized cupredoxin-like copper-binding protein